MMRSADFIAVKSSRTVFRLCANAFGVRPRIIPDIGNVFSSKPAAGTSLFSMPLSAPIKTISADGRRFLTYLAMAIAGLICPAVPPPASMIFTMQLLPSQILRDEKLFARYLILSVLICLETLSTIPISISSRIREVPP